jgi:hypothetical protein
MISLFQFLPTLVHFIKELKMKRETQSAMRKTENSRGDTSEEEGLFRGQ